MQEIKFAFARCWACGFDEFEVIEGFIFCKRCKGVVRDKSDLVGEMSGEEKNNADKPPALDE